jgi:hypothetical protein
MSHVEILGRCLKELVSDRDVVTAILAYVASDFYWHFERTEPRRVSCMGDDSTVVTWISVPDRASTHGCDDVFLAETCRWSVDFVWNKSAFIGLREIAPASRWRTLQFRESGTVMDVRSAENDVLHVLFEPSVGRLRSLKWLVVHRDLTCRLIATPPTNGSTARFVSPTCVQYLSGHVFNRLRSKLFRRRVNEACLVSRVCPVRGGLIVARDDEVSLWPDVGKCQILGRTPSMILSLQSLGSRVLIGMKSRSLVLDLACPDLGHWFSHQDNVLSCLLPEDRVATISVGGRLCLSSPTPDPNAEWIVFGARNMEHMSNWLFAPKLNLAALPQFTALRVTRPGTLLALSPSSWKLFGLHPKVGLLAQGFGAPLTFRPDDGRLTDGNVVWQ